MAVIRKILFGVADDERGIAAIEYSLLAGLIAIGMLTGLGELAGSVAAKYDHIGSEVEAARQ